MNTNTMTLKRRSEGLYNFQKYDFKKSKKGLWEVQSDYSEGVLASFPTLKDCKSFVSDLCNSKVSICCDGVVVEKTKDQYNRERAKTLKEQEKREALHNKQVKIDADIASIKVFTSKDSAILINTGSDGTCKYAICTSWDEVPSYYKDTDIVLLNDFKIMHYDCYDRYDQPGEEVKTTYCRILKSGMSVIFLNLYQD